MAKFKPGPLVSSISGCIGGASFLQHGANPLLRTRAKPVATASPTLNTSRNYLRGAGARWAALTTSQREAWARLAAELTPHAGALGPQPYSPFGAFCAALIAQAGRTSPVIPPTPTALFAQAPYTPVFAAHADGLYLAGADRTLTTGESIILRGFRAVPSHWTKPPYRIAAITEHAYPSGLTPVADYAVSLPVSTSLITTTASIVASGSWSIELWFKISAARPGADQCLMHFSTGTWVVGFNNSSYLLYTPTGSYTFGSPGVSLDTWHYICLTANASTNQFGLYVDGALLGGTVPKAPPAVAGAVQPGRGWWSGAYFIGTMDEVRISNTIRTGPEVTANWRSGAGLPLQVDANTRALWHFSQANITPLLDSSGNGFSLTGSDIAMVPGRWNQFFYPVSARRLAPPCKVRVLSVPGRSNLFFGPRSYTDFSWPV